MAGVEYALRFCGNVLLRIPWVFSCFLFRLPVLR